MNTNDHNLDGLNKALNDTLLKKNTLLEEEKKIAAAKLKLEKDEENLKNKIYLNILIVRIY
jgi:hypothetical protein